MIAVSSNVSTLSSSKFHMPAEKEEILQEFLAAFVWPKRPSPTITKQLAHLNWHACTMKAEGEQDLARNTRLILNGDYRPLEKLAF